MINVPVTNIPNQSLSINLDNIQFDIRIHASQDGQLLFFDISANNEIIVNGQRALPDYPLIPYRYLEQGNFVMITDNDEYPRYDQLGMTQYLIYASASELATIRG